MADMSAHRVLLGVMSNPSSYRLRSQLREWNNMFSSYRHSDVTVRYVFGSSFYNGTDAPTYPPPAAIGYARSEAAKYADLLFVDGRERLPHVGVVTEKSAAFWRAIRVKEPGFAFYCKSDDDTMVHLDRLHRILAQIVRTEGPERPVYFGHMKWRGWDEGYRFQACGGSWGNAAKTKQDILVGGPIDLRKPDGEQYPPCPNAAGPYPYMSGGMVCMSNSLVRIVASDAAFGDFLTVAKARNDHGERCKRPRLCADQPAAVHMWHHEDAGIGFNVFRAVVDANATASIVPTPGHFNDPDIIERTPSPQDLYWSSRSVFVHGIKRRVHYETALQRWTLGRSSDHLTLRCKKNCSEHGADGFHWDWARLPCPRPKWSEPQPGHFCDVRPHEHYHCCSWPWVVPALRSAILAALAVAPGQRLGVHALVRGTRLEVAKAAHEVEGCRGECAKVEVPSGQHLHPILEDLHDRGDVVYSIAGRPHDEIDRGEAVVSLTQEAAAAAADVAAAALAPAIVETGARSAGAAEIAAAAEHSALAAKNVVATTV